VAGQVTGGLRVAVLISTGRACVFCGGTLLVQVEHVRPVAAGGLDVPANLVTLCQPCNMIKSDFWPDWGYHPFPGHDDPQTAADILDAELHWLSLRHSQAEIDAQVFWPEDPPGTWAWRRLPDGFPRWAAEFYPSRYGHHLRQVPA
jgi:HNH endonuclease